MHLGAPIRLAFCGIRSSSVYRLTYKRTSSLLTINEIRNSIQNSTWIAEAFLCSKHAWHRGGLKKWLHTEQIRSTQMQKPRAYVYIYIVSRKLRENMFWPHRCSCCNHRQRINATCRRNRYNDCLLTTNCIDSADRRRHSRRWTRSSAPILHKHAATHRPVFEQQTDASNP